MSAGSEDPIVIAVSLHGREDGGLRVSSPDLRGLHLAGADREHVWEMIAPAITSLLQRNHGVRVASVRPSRSAGEALSQLPQAMDVRVDRQRLFVVELAA